jgi:16S rRNA (adenine1518-N6/adenine1519-N6)-dimethyltransferase
MKPRKALGQHFLADTAVLHKILATSDLVSQDIVVEVGPGRGALTRYLVPRAKQVIAIEMDPNLADSLSQNLGSPSNLKVINADAREVDLEEVVEQGQGYKMVANLPYYAANPILRRFLEAGPRRPSLMVVMVQKEVARRMAAQPGEMGLLSVAVQFYGVPRIVDHVPPGAFRPPPKVTSAIVRIDPLAQPAIDVENVEGFFDLVRAGFSAPRKQLRNSLSMGLGISPEDSGHLLSLAGMDPKRRPEDLSIPEWGKLYRVVEQAIRPDSKDRAASGS